jgi:peroxiredoxin
MAPPFTLPAHTGEQISLTDYIGKRDVVLVFYMFNT